ncbi:MAG: protein kinase [Sandaracinaceae bacterium]
MAGRGEARSSSGAGAWIVGETLGKGGIGVVYAATHSITGRRGALKVAHRSGGAVRAHWFRRERELVARLRHRHIVALLDAGEIDGQDPFLVYELVEGTTLEEAADALDLRDIIAIGCQLLDALGYAHDAGVIHCDVTPANVLVAEGSAPLVVKLTDFGLARAKADAHVRRMGGQMQVSGTPGYLSPEQAKGAGSPGPTSDLFSLGAVLFRLLTGYAPYGGDSAVDVVRHTLSSAPLPLRPRRGLRAPARLAEVVQKLLARDPEHRYPNAARAKRALEDATLGRTPFEGTTRNAPPPAPGLLSFETIVLDPVRSTGAAQPYSTMRATPSAGLTRERIPLPRAVKRDVRGRDDELAALEAALSRTDDSACTVALVGEPGSGKTAVVGALRARLRQRSVRTYMAQGRRGVPCAPLEVLAALTLDAIDASMIYPARLAAERLADELERLPLTDAAGTMDALIGGLLGVGPRGGSAAAMMEAYEGFVGLLRIDSRPVALMIDDAEDLDEGSWEVLRRVAVDHPGHVAVLWVGARNVPSDVRETMSLRADAPGTLDAAFAHRGPAGAMRPPARVVADAAALGVIASLGGPPDFGAFLEAIPTATRRALEVAAVYGGDIPRRAIPKVASGLGVTPEAAHAAMEDLLREGLLGEVAEPAARMERWLRLGSPALREATLRAMSPAALTNAHALAAQWLTRESLDDNASNRARVAELASKAGLLPSAAHALAEAGRLELESTRPARAAPYLTRALELAEAEREARGAATDAIDEPRVVGQLAEIALAAGEPVRALELADRALRELEPSRDVLRARLRGVRADALSMRGRLEEARAELESALAELEDDGDPMETARACASLGWVLGYRLGRNAEGIALGRRALEVASSIFAPAFRASLCGRLGANYLRAGDWDGQLATNQEDLRLSTMARDPSGIVRANINLGVCFHNRGALELARSHTERALALAQRCGSHGAAQIAHNNLAMIAFDQGRLDDAERHADAVRESAERTGYRRALPETLITSARIALRRGDPDGAESALAMAEQEGDVADLEMANRARAWLEVARGEPERARERLESLLGRAEHDPYERALGRVTLASVLRHLGRGEEADAREAEAAAALTELGADPEVERRRWGIDAG